MRLIAIAVGPAQIWGKAIKHSLAVRVMQDAGEAATTLGRHTRLVAINLEERLDEVPARYQIARPGVLEQPKGATTGPPTGWVPTSCFWWFLVAFVG